MLLFGSIGIGPDAQGSCSTVIPANQLVGQVIRLILTCSDMREAFFDFQSLLGDSHAPSDPMKGFLAFDAHVTDCGCHLRAQMLQDLIMHFKNVAKVEIEIFQVMIKNLEQLENECISLINRLCWNNSDPSKIGLPRTIKEPTELLKFLNWKGKEINTFLGETDCHNRPSERTGYCERSWSAKSSRMILEFVFCSHFLSKHKIYNKRDKVDSVTINFEGAFEKRLELANRHHCNGQGKFGSGCRYLKHAKESKNVFTSRVANIQARLAHLSVSFLKSINHLQIDMIELSKVSTKNITAIPNFLHFLILEREWTKKNTPLLLAVRYLNCNVFFDIYFKVRINSNTLEWELEEKKREEFDSDIPYVVITALAANVKKNNTPDQLKRSILQGHKRMRQFWLSFMSQHPQYPFKTGCCEKEYMRTKLPQELSELYFVSNSLELDKILIGDGTTFTPKHIFTEYPNIFFHFQDEVKGKKGALVI